MFIKNPKLPLYALPIFSFIGFLDATYLTVLHYKNAIPPCSISGCETVLTSKFSTINGIPISLLGSGFYLTILICALIFKETRNSKVLWLLVVLANAGFVVALVLVGIQFGILHNFCLYCLASEGISTLIFAATLIILKQYLEEKH